MNEKILALKLIAENMDTAIDFLNKEISAPNIPTPTLGGEVFWNDLAEYNGWRLQQNMFTKHARILDANNVRRAWGTVNAMYTALDRLVESMEASRYKNKVPADVRDDAASRLKTLKQLLDIGAISEEEYNIKKKELIEFL